MSESRTIGLAVAVLIVGAAYLLSARKTEASALVKDDGRDAPRGIRNNNPGNLIYSPLNNWQGQIGGDPYYAVFETPLYGIRAMLIDLRTGFVRDSENTVRMIIEEWAPHSENPTENYISFVSERIGHGPDDVLSFNFDAIPIAKAITEFENGYNPYPDELFERALNLAGQI